MDTSVSFAHSSSAWEFGDWVARTAISAGATSICEVGGGANPLLDLDFVQERGIDYIVLDTSHGELAKAPKGYRTAVAKVGSETFVPLPRSDVVVTRMVLEHVENPRRFHAQIYELLNPGGQALHFFSTLYSPPFVANRLLPERIARSLLLGLQPDRDATGAHGRFPAFYRWCRGPSLKQIRRFESVGFRVDEYIGFFGHWYFQRVRFLQRVEDAASRLLSRHPISWLTSYAWVRMSKPM